MELNTLYLIFTRPAGRIYLSPFTLFTPLLAEIVAFSFTACIARGLIGDPYHSRRYPSPNLYSGASTGVARAESLADFADFGRVCFHVIRESLVTIRRYNIYRDAFVIK